MGPTVGDFLEWYTVQKAVQRSKKMRGIRARLGAAGNSDEDEDPEECILTPCWMSSFKVNQVNCP